MESVIPKLSRGKDLLWKISSVILCHEVADRILTVFFPSSDPIEVLYNTVDSDEILKERQEPVEDKSTARTGRSS